MPIPEWRAEFKTPADADGWSVFDRCGGRWEIESGVMVQSSNCGNQNSPVPKARLGTMLMTEDQTFDQGWLAAHVYSGERRTIGIAYGESIYDFIRVRLDIPSRTLAIERLDVPPFQPQAAVEELPSIEVLAQLEGVELPYRRWYWLAVRRQGEIHEVWVDGAKMLQVTLPFQGVDTIGIYSYGNIDARVEWVARYSLDYTPWEPLP